MLNAIGYWIVGLCMLFATGCQDAQVVSKMMASRGYPANLPGTLTLPEQGEMTGLVLICPSDNTQFPLQAFGNETYLFVPSRNIVEGEELRIIQTQGEPEPSVQISHNDSILSVKINEQEVLQYAIKPQLPSDTIPSYYTRSGFIHPLKTRKGRVVTAGFPKGHTHQHGVFNAWTRTTFRDTMIDFWNQQAQLGSVSHDKVLGMVQGPVFSSFQTSLSHRAFVNSDTIHVLNEKWMVKIIPLQKGYLLDWTTDQSCAASDTLHIREYHYGGAAFRGSEHWNVPGGAYDSLVYFLTSQHKSQADGNHSRPKWATMFGRVPDSYAGVAMMGHPSNFRHPQPIRIHPSMPYFCFAPMVLGAFDLIPGERYENRYGIFVYDDRPETTTIETVQNAFSEL